MADTSLGWEIEGVISTEESVSAMLKVISTKTHKDSGKFWTWEGKVRASECHFQAQPPGLTHTGAPVVRTTVKITINMIQQKRLVAEELFG